jgi:hypothetical protein
LGRSARPSDVECYPLLPRVDRCDHLATTCRNLARKEARKAKEIECVVGKAQKIEHVVIDDTSCKDTEILGGDSLWARAPRVLLFSTRRPLPKLDTQVAQATGLFSFANRNRLSKQDSDAGQLLRSRGELPRCKVLTGARDSSRSRYSGAHGSVLLGKGIGDFNDAPALCDEGWSKRDLATRYPLDPCARDSDADDADLWARAPRVLLFATRRPLPKLDTHVARETRLFSYANRNRLSKQDSDAGQLLRPPGRPPHGCCGCAYSAKFHQG